MVRSIQNSLAPITRVPREILSLIPDYYCEDSKDRDLIASTHVCRAWRDTFISRSSLWARLHFTEIVKTNTYIQRSQSSPLELHLEDRKGIDSVFALVTPHICRVKSLVINTRTLAKFLGYFHCHSPPLEELSIQISTPTADKVVLDGSLFNGDFSSLRYLRLSRVFPHFSWKMANLRVVNLENDSHGYETSQILDFFESAPLLHTISLFYPLQDPSDTSSERVVRLRHLKKLTINTRSSHANLLCHLDIPVGASLSSMFRFRGEESPLLDYLPERSQNFNNLSRITTINLQLDPMLKFVQLSGPSGSLCVGFYWEPSSYTNDYQILRSFTHPMCSTTKRLAISSYKHPRPANVEECPVLQMALSMNDLQTLVLIDCNDVPFILALDPEQNPSNLVLCPGMQKLILYTEDDRDLLNVKHLIAMAKNRASRGAKLSSVTFVDLGGNGRREEVLRLREHVAHVEYRVDVVTPTWNDLPGVNRDESE